MAFVPEPSPNLHKEKIRNSRVNDKPRDNFQFAWNPRDWQCNAKGEMVPTIVHLSKAPGVNGVDQYGDFEAAHAHYRKQGWRFIPHDVLGDQDYVAAYLNMKGQRVCRTIFTQPYNTAEGTTEWAHDGEAWSMFIKLLRQRGIVQQPEPPIVSGWLEKKEAEVGQLRAPPQSDGPGMARYQEKSEMLHAQLMGLRAELVKSEALYGAPASRARSRIADLLADAVEADPEEQRLVDGIANKIGVQGITSANPLSDLGLQPQLAQTLFEAGLTSPGQLSMMSGADLLGVAGIGPKALEAIEEALAIHGMALAVTE